MNTRKPSVLIRYLLCLVAFVGLAACSSKLKDEYDFRPYIAAWAGKHCGTGTGKYNCLLQEGFADGFFDGEDFVYGVWYLDPQRQRRVVYVKVAAVKPYERSVVDDRPAEEKSE
jgi:hypothetical protein